MSAESSAAALIRQRRQLQNAAIVAGDDAVIISFWTQDITVRRALGQAVYGVQEALAALKSSDDNGLIYQREAQIIEVSPHWPLAFEEGHWHGHAESIDTPAIISGRYAAQWVKRDGLWLIRSELFVALDCADMGCSAAALP